MAKPNYSFEKRQRDLEKKRKQEEKRLRKLAEKKLGETDDSAGDPIENLAEAAEIPSDLPENQVDAASNSERVGS